MIKVAHVELSMTMSRGTQSSMPQYDLKLAVEAARRAHEDEIIIRVMCTVYELAALPPDVVDTSPQHSNGTCQPIMLNRRLQLPRGPGPPTSG